MWDLETRRVNRNDDLGIAYDALIGEAQEGYYESANLFNSLQGADSDGSVRDTYDLALAGDPQAQRMFEQAGLDLESVRAISDPDEQVLRVAEGLWRMASAKFDIVARTHEVASSGGAARGYYRGAERALKLLANGFEGIGSIGLDRVLAESIPGPGAAVFGSLNLSVVAAESEAVNYLRRAGYVDSDAASELQYGLAEQYLSSLASVAIPVPGSGKYSKVAMILTTFPAELLEKIPIAEGARFGSAAEDVGKAARRSTGEIAASLRKAGRFLAFLESKVLTKHFPASGTRAGSSVTLDGLMQLPLEKQLNLHKDIKRLIFMRSMGLAPEGLKFPVRHHLIPLEVLAEYPDLMKKAAQGGFDISGKGNGVWLNAADHGSHNQYFKTLDKMINRISPNLTPAATAERVQGIADTLMQAAKDRTFLPREW